MVYYFTSSNLLTLKNIIGDYDVSDVTPIEYMQTYIERYTDTDDDSKLCWIVETFLDITRHRQFIKEVLIYFPSTINKDDSEYFLIMFYAMTFKISTVNLTSLYKCLFNISKPLLSYLLNLFKRDELVKEISKLAMSIYDANFIADKIVKPLLAWQPRMNELAEKYSNYLKKAAENNVKQLTVPIEPNVLQRKILSKKKKQCLPQMPPNSIIGKTKRMVSKNTIDEKLKQAHAKNKQRAMHLLNEIKNNTNHYAQSQIKKYLSEKCDDKNSTEQCWIKSSKSFNGSLAKTSSIPVKETVAMVKRLNERFKKSEQEEIQWLQDLVNDCRNTKKIRELEDFDREERERQRLINIEKKHLLGQISFEEAVLAKKRVWEENKKKREEMLNQKDLWNKEIEKLNKQHMESNRKIFEKLSLLELNVIEAKEKATFKKKEEALQVKEESKSLLLEAIKDKQMELERKIQMVKEFKILTLIAKRAKIPKILDLTETSGLGLLCEMSIAELQERLSSMKVILKDELETKRKLIKERNLAAKNELEETRSQVYRFLNERQKSKTKNIKSVTTVNVSSKELDQLKIILEEKRKQRLELTAEGNSLI